MTLRTSLLAAIACGALAVSASTQSFAQVQTPGSQTPPSQTPSSQSATPALPTPASQAPTTQTPTDQAPTNQAPSPALPGAAATVPVAPVAGPFTPLAPQPGQDIVAVLTASGQFTTLLKAATATGLAPVLGRPGVTVFAPTDAAFSTIPADQLAQMMTPAGLPQLQKAIAYHVINTRLTADTLKGKVSKVATASGEEIYVDGTGDMLKVNDANVLQPAVAASNGEIYVIDKVVKPGFTPPTPAVDATPAPEAAPAATTTTSKSTSTKSTSTKKKR